MSNGYVPCPILLMLIVSIAKVRKNIRKGINNEMDPCLVQLQITHQSHNQILGDVCCKKGWFV